MGHRALVPGSAHRTPIPDLYLCGSSCHPGPGITFLPGGALLISNEGKQVRPNLLRFERKR